MGLCRGSDSAFADRQISHTACGIGLEVYPKPNLCWTMGREWLFSIGRNSPTLELPIFAETDGGAEKKVAPRASVDDPSLRRLLQGSLCCCH